eukprot:47504-Eustigmatos_ZCMA.PRE.1
MRAGGCSGLPDGGVDQVHGYSDGAHRRERSAESPGTCPLMAAQSAAFALLMTWRCSPLKLPVIM